MALSTQQISTSRFLPPVLAAGIKGSISSHCSLVRLLEYTLLIALYGSVSLYLQIIPGELFLLNF